MLFVLNMWLLRDVLRLKSETEFGTLLAEFVNSASPPLEEQPYFRFIHQWLKKYHNTIETLRRVHSNSLSLSSSSSSSAGSSLPYFTALLDLEDKAIAEQLTYIDNKLFRAVKFSDLLHKNFQEASSSPGFTAMMRKFNLWGGWVATEIVSCERQVQQRAALIHKFIRIAAICLELRSFNTAYAIVAGLENSSVCRLKITWGHVPKEGQTTFNFLKHVFDMSKNYNNYRTVLQQANPPLVPYLGLYPKDLFAIEENVPTKQEQGLISLTKLRRLHEIIHPLQEYQLGKNYVIKRDSVLQKYLKNVRVLSSDEQYQKSLNCEARASSVKYVAEHGIVKTGSIGNLLPFKFSYAN